MPIYEFKCQACGTEVEVLQKISDPHLTDCDACGKSEMKKKVTAAAFRLSGAGWYETDFKEGDKKKNLTESKSSDGDKKTSDGSGDKKESAKASGTSDSGSDKTTEKSKTETTTKESAKPSKSIESKTD